MRSIGFNNALEHRRKCLILQKLLQNNLAFYSIGLIDTVSGEPLEVAIAGTRADLVNGIYTEFGVNEPTIMVDEDGKWQRSVGAYTNHYFPSGAPVTKSITLAIGAYTMWVEGTGSAEFDSNIATEDTPISFTLTSETTATLTITGTVSQLQINDGDYLLSYIATTTAARLSADESGGATNGMSYEDISTDLPVLYNALGGIAYGSQLWDRLTTLAPGASGVQIHPWIHFGLSNGDKVEVSANLSGYSRCILKMPDILSGSNGLEVIGGNNDVITNGFHVIKSIIIDNTLSIKINNATDGIVTDILIKKISTAQGRLELPVKFGFDAADVSGDMNILSFNDEATSPLIYDATNNQFKLTDGTNTATVAHTAVADAEVDIIAEWGEFEGNPKMWISADGAVGAMVYFVGNIPNTADRLVYGFDNDELIYTGPLKIEKIMAMSANDTFIFHVVDSLTVSGLFNTTSSITIDWGDGDTDSYNGTDQAYTHTYASTGYYTVTCAQKDAITKLIMDAAGCNVNFNIADAPAKLTSLRIYGSNTLTGDIADAPANLTYLYISGSNTLTGDIADAPANLTYLYISGSNTISDYTAKTWTTKLATLEIVPVSPGGLSESEINQLLIDLDDDFEWSTGTITLTGTNAAPTGLGLTAKANMQSEGTAATVVTN
jgi:hypothetical protein